MTKFIVFFFALFYSIILLGIERPPLWVPSIMEISDAGTISREFTPGVGVPEGVDDIKILSLSEGPATFGLKLGLSYKSEKKIINLSKGRFGTDGRLRPADPKGEYLVYDRLGVEVPIGGKFTVGAGVIGGFLTFIPSGGKEAIRKVRNFEEIEKLPKAKFPLDLNTLRKSLPRLGDRMSFFVEGGLTMGVSGMGDIAIDIGARFLVKGRWEVSLVRTGPTKLMATLKKVSVIGIKVLTTTLITDLGVRFIRKKLNHITYEYDFADEKGVELFKNLLKGNVIDSEDYLRKHPNSNIVRMEKRGVLITKNKGLFARLSIPAFFALGTESSIEDVYSSEFLNAENKTVQARFGIFKYQSYVNSLITGLKIKKVKKGNVKRTKMFLGQVRKKETSDLGEVKKFDYAANIKFQFSGTNYNKKQYDSEIRKMIRWTGLTKEFKFDMPEKIKHRYLQVDFDILISNYAIRDLLKKFHKYKRKQWIELALVSLKNYFRNNDDPFGICPEKWGRIICKKFVKLRTAKSMEKMYKLLKKMKESLKDKNIEGFTKHYAKFGRYVLYNPFTYKALIWVMRKQPMKAVITARGQDILFHQKIVPFYNFQEK